ncbi:MAG: TolC family protein [Nannocystaceae bacterium]
MFVSTAVMSLGLLDCFVGQERAFLAGEERITVALTSRNSPAADPAPDPIARALAVAPGGLTSKEAARRAVETGPSVAVARAQLRAAVAQVDALRKSFTPALTVEASYARLSEVESGIPLDDMAMAVAGDLTFDIPLNQYSLNATLGLPVSDWILRVIPSLSAGKAGSRAAEYQRDAEIRTVATDAKIAYYGWLRARAQVAVAEASLERSRARLKDAQVGVNAGMMSPADVMRIDALVARTEAGLESARAVERVARRTLAVLMGEDIDTDYGVGEDVMSPRTAVADGGDLNSMVAQGLSDRPELAAIGASVDQAEASIKARRAEYYPRVGAFGEAVYANPNRRFFPPTNGIKAGPSAPRSPGRWTWLW